MNAARSEEVIAMLSLIAAFQARLAHMPDWVFWSLVIKFVGDMACVVRAVARRK